jgi:hypothetical protein
MTLETGAVIAEIDGGGHFVDLWVVVTIELRSSGTYPQTVRNACRPDAAVETWTGKAWRAPAVAHRFALPGQP